MPRNASGAYSPPANTSAVSGQTISPSAYNTLQGDLGSEITNSLDRNGRGAMAADLSFGGYKAVNLGTPTQNADGATKAYVDAAIASALAVMFPPGTIVDFGMNAAPAGWLECNGAAVSRTTYANLFAKIGTTWGAGDGATTFNLPDRRGVFPRGFDNGRGIDPGRVFGTYQADDNKSHNHTASDLGHTHGYTSPGAGQSGIGYAGFTSAGASTTGVGYANISVGSSGGSEARPKNVTAFFCIKI